MVYMRMNLFEFLITYVIYMFHFFGIFPVSDVYDFLR